MRTCQYHCRISVEQMENMSRIMKLISYDDIDGEYRLMIADPNEMWHDVWLMIRADDILCFAW